MFTKLIRFYSGPLCLALCLASSTVLAHDDPADSAAALTAHIAEEPGNVALHLKRGDLYRLSKNWPEALTDYRKAAELVDDPVEIDGLLGEVYVGLDRPNDALPCLDRYLKRYPDNDKALEVRGDAYVSARKFDQAADDYTRALKLTGRPKPSLYLKLAEAQKNAGDFAAGLATIDAGVAALGPAITLLEAGVNLELARANYTDALRRFNSLPAKLRETPAWLVKRGDILLLDAQTTLAIESYDQARTLLREMPAQRRQLPAMQKVAAELETRPGEANPGDS